MSIEKRDHQRPSLLVKPNGSLAGHEFAMRRMSIPEWLAYRRGAADADLVELAVKAIEDSSLREDPAIGLDGPEAHSLMMAWLRAHVEEAVPEASGETSTMQS